MVLLAVRFVVPLLKAGGGEARDGPPRTRPKSLAAAKFRFSRQTLKSEVYVWMRHRCPQDSRAKIKLKGRVVLRLGVHFSRLQRPSLFSDGFRIYHEANSDDGCLCRSNLGAGSGSDEGQQVFVDLVFVRGAKAMRRSGVDFERRSRDQIGRKHGRVGDGHDLVIVAVQDQGGHINLLKILGLVCF